jgi:hypothetical protein
MSTFTFRIGHRNGYSNGPVWIPGKYIVDRPNFQPSIFFKENRWLDIIHPMINKISDNSSITKDGNKATKTDMLNSLNPTKNSYEVYYITTEDPETIKKFWDVKNHKDGTEGVGGGLRRRRRSLSKSSRKYKKSKRVFRKKSRSTRRR